MPPLRLAMMTENLFGSYRIGGATAAGVKPLERLAVIEHFSREFFFK